MHGPMKIKNRVHFISKAGDGLPSSYASPILPRLAVGGVVFHENRVLLVKRNKAPAKGQWAIPGGRVEPGETMVQAVQRELLEETGIVVRVSDTCYLFESLVNGPDGALLFHYVIVDFLAHYISGDPAPASDVSAAAWVSPVEVADLPVNENTVSLLKKLAFFS